jgi:hypothetical protein
MTFARHSSLCNSLALRADASLRVTRTLESLHLFKATAAIPDPSITTPIHLKTIDLTSLATTNWEMIPIQMLIVHGD